MFSSNTSQVSNDVKYIEDFCSVYLRTGTGSSQTVTTGVKENTGALVISKSRSAATDWAWYDTFRGATKELASNTTAAEITQSQGLTSFNTDGHTWGTLAKVNTSGATYVDFVLKPTPKFFDVVTYTGNGITPRIIAHNLTSTPGFIIVKRTDTTGNWAVLAQTGSGTYTTLQLNTASASQSAGLYFGSGTTFIPPSSTGFTVSANADVNANGGTYVAYIFAHNAGGFGLTGTDNVISCGSFTTDANGVGSATLGYEPQFLITKRSDNTGDWNMFDIMRGMPVSADQRVLLANTADAEFGSYRVALNATGFTTDQFSANSTFIYIAIRRGPMKTPTSGTSVYNAIARTGTGAAATVTGVGFAPDLAQIFGRDVGANWAQMDRLRGTNKPLGSNLTAAEDTGTDFLTAWGMDGVTLGANSRVNASGGNFINHFFRRAPGFFDEVCYTGVSGATATFNHNLGVAPELVIVKMRSSPGGDPWIVGSSLLSGGTRILRLNTTDASIASTLYKGASSTTFSVAGDSSETSYPGYTYVAYLFASAPGVSKVGSYTGTGTTQQINCGFTAGARFVLIKRTDSTGDWYVWDSARGIVAGNDPYLLLNSTAAEVTGFNFISPASAGFVLVNSSNVNLNGASYIFLAIA